MIKINLLDSVTERQAGAVVAVDRKIGSPMSKFVVMSIAVAVLFLTVVGIDVIGTRMAKNKAEAQIEEQKQIQAELAVVLKEQKDLEQKIANIDARIDAIKKLKSIQSGPSEVLDSMVERISAVPGLYLESIEQTGDELIIKGSSPSDEAVINFGRSLEFSDSLFTNLSIETERRELRVQAASQTSTNPEEGLLHIVGFKITCAYKKGKGDAPKDATTAANNPPATAPAAAGTNPPQIAKN
jgi:Tfp pilus assembly protein PilN